MAAKRRVIVERLEPQPSGVIQIRMRKELVEADGTLVPFTEDGKQAIFRYHRTVIEPGVDATKQLAAVNVDLARQGWPAVDQESWDALVAPMVADKQTPAVVQDYQDLQAAQRGVDKAVAGLK